MASSKNGPFSAVNFFAVKRKVLLFFTGVLILFIVLSWLFGASFLWRLTKFYSHGGEQLFAYLVSCNIHFGMLPTLDSKSFTASCISQDGRWGFLTLYWDPDDINDRRESLLNREEAKQEGYIRDDLWYMVWASGNKPASELNYSFFLNRDRWALEWDLFESSDTVAAERLEEFLVILTDEKSPLPYRWRLEYYRDIVMSDLDSFLSYWNRHNDFLRYLSIFIELPKPVILWIWYRLFALFPPGALKMVLFAWNILMAAALAGTIMIYSAAKIRS